MTLFADVFGTPQPVALVTGSGAPRIGNVVARRLAAAGCRLIIHAHRSGEDAVRTAAELRACGAEALARTADLSDERAVGGLAAEIDAEFGRIDILVNCAAVWHRKRLEDTTAGDVRQQFEINTVSTFLCCQHFGLRMCDQPLGGAIVNLGDWAVVRPYREYAAYFPSKGAIPTLTRTFAVELAARNPRVRVNAILPGPVMLPPDLPASEREAAIRSTLVQREGSPEHVAHAVQFLVENDFVTGVCLTVDGGRTIFGS